MSQGTPSSDAVTAPSNSGSEPESVFLVSYPKIIYLYPTVLTALFCGIFMWAKGGIPQDEIRVAARNIDAASELQQSISVVKASFGSAVDETASANPAAAADENAEAAASSDSQSPEPGSTPETFPTENPASDPESTVTDVVPGSEAAEVPAAQSTDVPAAEGHTYHNACARIFLLILAMNLVVIAFDFPRTTSLTWFFASMTIVIGLWFLLKANPWLAPQIVTALLKIKPTANATFYLIFSGIMLFLYICVLISRRFDYWEVKGNELLHHHGFLSNLERFSAPNLRIDKEINDLFEYLLLRSGRLIIHASNERRAIVLENVLFINQKEERITRMLGALQVRVRTERE
ncbi:MAG: hypothetical protein R3C17_14210 [Planctomycetaceae bacterium]